MPRRPDAAGRLADELAGQLEHQGLAPDEARALAAREVAAWRDRPATGDRPPWLVLPDAHGWRVTRAFAPTDAERFDARPEAEARARALAAADGCDAVVCDASGRELRRLEPERAN